ncbi:MAG: 1-acyl-sn-glycerol-3-phosphate acyltransferase [Candidatus Sumerlaeia bacterium]|nr:1-acyl-sn-glycerol-3-phosphate acyltransferase [Candidatus Sumerlaeia bacterium]
MNWLKLLFREPIRRLLQLLLILLYGYKVKGLHLIPTHGPVIIVANHQSYYDPVLIATLIRRPLRFAAMMPLFKVKPLALVMRLFQTIPIEREGPDKSAYQKILSHLNRNEIVTIFPEGTRTADGNIQSLKPGFVRIAIRANAVIVPAVIVGAFEVWPRQRRLPRFRGKISVKFYPPLKPPHLSRDFTITERKLLEYKICQTIHKIFTTRLTAWQKLKSRTHNFL